MSKNRSHGKIDNLPYSVKKEVENRLLEGFTYQEISDYLKKMGHDVHLSSVHRYGKPFLKKFENVRMAKEFATLLAEDNAERPTTEIHEANNAIVSQLLMEVLVDEKITNEEKIKAAKAISTLQRAQVSNERVKIQSRKELGDVRIAMNILKSKVYEELEAYPDITEKIIEIAEEVEKDLNV